MAYEKKFRESVLSHLTKGHTQESTAKLFGIGTTTLKEWKRRKEVNESFAPRKRQGKPKKLAKSICKSYEGSICLWQDKRKKV